MAALLEGLHWQAKSVTPQPTPEAAEEIHWVWILVSLHDLPVGRLEFGDIRRNSGPLQQQRHKNLVLGQQQQGPRPG